MLLVGEELAIVKFLSGTIEKLGFKKPPVPASLDEMQGIARNAMMDLPLGVTGEGQTAARQLKWPVGFLSSVQEKEKQRNISLQSGYVIKPADHRNLKKMIENIFARRQQSEKFFHLLTDLPQPGAILGGQPLEILAWNKSFANKFLLSDQYDFDRSNSSQRISFVSKMEKYTRQVITEKKPVRFECALLTHEGDRKFEINATRIDSVDQPAMLVSLKDISNGEPGSEHLMQSNSVFHNIFWNAPVMMMQLDHHGILRNVNNQWLQVTGYSQGKVLGKEFELFLSEDSARIFQNEILSRLNEPPPFPEIEVIFHLQKGYQKLFSVKFSRYGESQNPPAIIGVLQETGPVQSIDLDDENTLASALRDSAAALTSTLNFDEVLDQILVNVGQVVPTEAANVMMIWSGVAYIVRSTGYAERGLEEAMMSLQLPINQEPHLLSMHETGMPLAVKDTREYAGLQYESGTDWARSIASAPLKSKGQVFGFLNLESSQAGFYEQKHAERLQAFADQAAVAIENARLYAEVQQYAITDELTTVYNRRGLFELGKREVERARRYGRSLSAIMLDIDKFKVINDTFTHSVGDQALRILADRLKSCIREVDILGRYGGDEFAVLLPETDLSSAVQVAERLRVAVSETPHHTSVGGLPLTISVGVAELSGDAITLEVLLEKADNAMFQAKTNGKNQVSC